jgi:hypothetical protein
VHQHQNQTLVLFITPCHLRPVLGATKWAAFGVLDNAF